MNLGELISRCQVKEVRGDTSVEIRGISADSREIAEGYLYVALCGTAADGHHFIKSAVENGAKGIVVEDLSSVPQYLEDRIAVVHVADSRKALGFISSFFFGEPSKKFKLAGITGTNGKTTTTYLLEAFVRAEGLSPAVIGTVNYRYAGKVLEAPNTTPGAVQLQKMMAEMAEGGTTHCIMEVSSHALDQDRVAACCFDTVVFTNLTLDHLDYHHSMEEYGKSKERLFLEGNEDKVAVINIDDASGARLYEKIKRTVSYGFSDGDITPVEMLENENGMKGTVTSPLGEIKVESPLIGRYNLYNIMAAAGAAITLGISKEAIEKGIRAFEKTPGRLERVELPHGCEGLRVFVDYAHTPDALDRVIKALKGTTKGRLITLFGCGGDRDRDKRPLMGKISAAESDYTIVTSDNPRSEDPFRIIEDIERGLKEAGMMAGEKYAIFADRRAAIRKGALMMTKGDTLLIAGKGHEDYQILGDGKIHFDDREEAQMAFKGLAETKSDEDPVERIA
ncbi:MAG: UDP-N-acetylmuramoyl-L-alanyl-D-glutamate--2,6-diaminopimelate ligase [Deltaproteobacteria bacterium]|nr:UDP-N-acetylmuramoyl-L-alanyl-D-glutamate--2,6-diaminopimelate ligase [Deltaproteobacteria bacterium]